MRSGRRRSGAPPMARLSRGMLAPPQACVRALCTGLILMTVSSGAPAADVEPHERASITMQNRQFVPASIVVHAGRKTTLLLDNEDVELHAFVPVGLFTGVSVRVEGNGAPQFDSGGLKKIVIPSHGRAEISFTPASPGVFPFFCDMPGHDMRAAIRVE